jgi:uncharacterized oligopeptide transporter (OPT) family protein
MLGTTYGFGSKELPAPQATLMKTIIEGVLSGQLPWDLVLTGGGISIAAMLCGVSGLAFAIGVYLPLASMMPIFVGGCVRLLCEGGGAVTGEHDSTANRGVLAASGLVAGEGLAGVAVAAGVIGGALPNPKDREILLAGVPGELLALLALLALCAFLYVAGRKRR